MTSTTNYGTCFGAYTTAILGENEPTMLLWNGLTNGEPEEKQFVMLYKSSTEGTEYTAYDFKVVNSKKILVASGGDDSSEEKCGLEVTTGGCKTLEKALTLVSASSYSFFTVTLSGKSSDANAWTILGEAKGVSIDRSMDIVGKEDDTSVSISAIDSSVSSDGLIKIKSYI